MSLSVMRLLWGQCPHSSCCECQAGSRSTTAGTASYWASVRPSARVVFSVLAFVLCLQLDLCDRDGMVELFDHVK